MLWAISWPFDDEFGCSNRTTLHAIILASDAVTFCDCKACRSLEETPEPLALHVLTSKLQKESFYRLGTWKLKLQSANRLFHETVKD